jgi:hypothetical protein
MFDTPLGSAMVKSHMNVAFTHEMMCMAMTQPCRFLA